VSDFLPHLITHIQTTDATETDIEHTEAIQQALNDRNVLPQTHLLDAGYVDAGLILRSRQHYDVEVVGPVSQNNQWQAQSGGYDASQFLIDWQSKQAICPQGKTSVKWTPGTDQQGYPNISVRFGLHDCRHCPARSLCTRSLHAPRHLTLRHQEEWEILQRARSHQQTEAFRALYARRSGIEGTHSQAVRTMGLRRTRFLGLKKTSLQHVLTAAALNLVRLDAHLAGKRVTKTRISRFATLAPTSLVS
jgi:transposase